MDTTKAVEEQLQKEVNALIMLRAKAFELNKGYLITCEKEKAQETVVLDLRAKLKQVRLGSQ